MLAPLVAPVVPVSVLVVAWVIAPLIVPMFVLATAPTIMWLLRNSSCKDSPMVTILVLVIVPMHVVTIVSWSAITNVMWLVVGIYVAPMLVYLALIPAITSV